MANYKSKDTIKFISDTELNSVLSRVINPSKKSGSLSKTELEQVLMIIKEYFGLLDSTTQKSTAETTIALKIMINMKNKSRENYDPLFDNVINPINYSLRTMPDNYRAELGEIADEFDKLPDAIRGAIDRYHVMSARLTGKLALKTAEMAVKKEEREFIKSLNLQMLNTGKDDR